MLQLINNKILFMEENEIDKFYFYSSYAKPVCKLNHNEAGQVIKAMCAFVFNDKEPSEKTLPKAKALFYLLFEQLDEAKKKKAKAAKRGVEHFTFTKALSKFFEALDDMQAGLLIKQCSNYAFGTPPLEESKATQVDEYFELIKPMLDKTIKQRENAKRHNENRKKPKITLEKIRNDFKEIRGNLNPDNDILKGVDLNKLYAFIKENKDIQTQSMYSIVDLYRQESGLLMQANSKPFTNQKPAASANATYERSK